MSVPMPSRSAPTARADARFPNSQHTEHALPAAARSRLSALDAWRGLTILLMLLVNNVALDTLTPRQLQQIGRAHV